MKDWMFDDTYSFDDDDVVEARIAKARSRLFHGPGAGVDPTQLAVRRLHEALADNLLRQCLLRWRWRWRR